MTAVICAYCGAAFDKRIGDVNKQRRLFGECVPFFCNRECSGARRRLNKSKEELAAEKAEYDREYRAKNRDTLRRKKQDYFRRTYDPASARERRAQRRESHRAYLSVYCARPEWKQHKGEYDRERRASAYGAFAESYKLLVELQSAVRVQPWYERAKERGYYDNNRNTLQRKRNERISRW